jgi:hypothetical protein
VENLEKIKEDLGARISKCNRIILGLQSNDAFNEMLSDFKDQMKRLDDSWQWITESKLLSDAQITKMAYLSVVNVLDNYKHDMEEADKQLMELNNPDKITGKDFDNEGVTNAQEN